MIRLWLVMGPGQLPFDTWQVVVIKNWFNGDMTLCWFHVVVGFGMICM